MGNGLYTFNDVTLLITHYNRSASLERLLNAFNRLNCTFAEIIVSDDASKADHFKRIQELQDEYGFNLLITHHNKGLGNNINKGQDAVKTPYTLYVQEDFIPKDAFPEHFTDALQLMDENPELDIARFYAYFKYPYLESFAKGFDRMKFKFWYPGYMKFYSYSDHPHLRRSTFFQKFGRYLEGVNGDKTEYNMCLSFLKNGGKGIFYHLFTTLFDQKNTSSEPSTADFRSSWTQRKNIFVRILRKVYLQYKFLKFSWDYLFYPKITNE
ncbi:glycosyltransferase family 2 protein [Pedobacter sp. BS3]|uniref:glycosyltransferase n=1 Tax=Pedobacter sp. BS3 TaxID=2567937 RepID=UPI0011EDEE7A|nr:glycosyltransferase [Pedobacter sp. BS3]TZF84758.1 glycosyltransferase family 2 protein [Pedobacter sp. BS3]